MPLEAAPKFICDDMLGELARWLRIIGSDVFYRNRLANDELIDIAAREGRIVLTRDLKLGRVLFDHGLPYYLVIENYPALQLREVVAHYSDRIRIRVFSRCTECNLVLEPVAKPAVEARVPPFVFQTQTNFRECPNCKKVYWAATHRAHVDEQLKYLLGEMYDKLNEEVWTSG